MESGSKIDVSSSTSNAAGPSKVGDLVVTVVVSAVVDIPSPLHQDQAVQLASMLLRDQVVFEAAFVVVLSVVVAAAAAALAVAVAVEVGSAIHLVELADLDPIGMESVIEEAQEEAAIVVAEAKRMVMPVVAVVMLPLLMLLQVQVVVAEDTVGQVGMAVVRNPTATVPSVMAAAVLPMDLEPRAAAVVGEGMLGMAAIQEVIDLTTIPDLLHHPTVEEEEEEAECTRMYPATVEWAVEVEVIVNRSDLERIVIAVVTEGREVGTKVIEEGEKEERVDAIAIVLVKTVRLILPQEMVEEMEEVGEKGGIVVVMLQEAAEGIETTTTIIRRR